jgi:RHS repeat-associated protein
MGGALAGTSLSDKTYGYGRSETPADGQSQSQGFAISAPALSLPKGGGAIRGMGEKFAANPVTGTGSMSVPIATSPGRGGFGLQLALSYDSGAGNGPFGLGWSLGIPMISRKTEKGLPQYLDATESDTFMLAGAEDLVPELAEDQGRLTDATVRVYGADYLIRRYRPRTEGTFARIERWTSVTDASTVFWRTISRDNITSWYGRAPESRVFDPENAVHIFQWFLCESYDDRGNAVLYRYKREDGAGVTRASVFEMNRPARSREAASYVASILYGNRRPFLPDLAADGVAWPDAPPDRDAWMFEVVFDYGDVPALAGSQGDGLQPELGLRGTWTVRRDPFSSHRAGFEIRTWRLCRRVLMLHHFPGEVTAGSHCLVRSTDLDYALPDRPEDAAQASYTVLRKVTQRSYQRTDPVTAPAAGYASAAMPPLEFAYSAPSVDATVRRIAAADLPNLPVGTQGSGYQWVDLEGEGLSGVLSEQGGAWHYSPNRGDGRFGPSKVVASVPTLAALAQGRQQLMDLAGDGEIDLVDFGSPTPGLFERDQDGGWKSHVPFASLPNIDWQDPNLRFVDLTGDGHADALVSEHGVWTWYPSLQETGFALQRNQRQAADEDAGPRLVFNDGTQSIFLADMCGDGLSDLVRIRNGELCYWPNLGYGRFGRKVTLANAPRFDAPDAFDPARIRLADIDGSGPTDVIYLGRSGAQLYFNRSGNSLSDARVVPLPVATHNLGEIQVVDLLGSGTACLVWNSPLPADAAHPVRYVDLMADGKPHLLQRVVNTLGGWTEVSYTPSTRFYLDDLAAGRPWLTRLPFPVHCISKVTVYDAWRGTAFSSTYSYHHGYFDGQDREFRGFGRVEQVDLDSYGTDANIDSPWVTDDRRLFQPPVKTVTWYHTGRAASLPDVLGQFAAEYFPQRFSGRLPTDPGSFAEKPLADPDLPAGLTALETHEALRACKGMLLRQETYELDLDDLMGPDHRQREVRLYTVTVRNCRIKRLQSRGPNRHAVFLVTDHEAITYEHDLPIPGGNPPLRPDPRISHVLTLRHDAYGNAEQVVTIGYPRWSEGSYPGLPEPRRIADVQAELHATYVEMRYTSEVLLPARDSDPLAPLRHYRLPQPCETRSYQLSGLGLTRGGYLGPDDLGRLQLSEDQRRFPAPASAANQRAVANLLYHQQPIDGTPHRRIITHSRTLYFDAAADDASPDQPLPLGQLGPRGLVYESYRLALTDALLDAVFADKLDWRADTASTSAPGRTCRDVLRQAARSGYVAGSAQGLGGRADEYWIRSGIAGFAPDANEHFFLPERFTDAFGATTTLRFDPLDLFVAQSSDARDNITRVERFDYRVLAPVELVDANGNHVEIAHDLRGLVVASALKGKMVQGRWQADTLEGFDFAQRNPSPWAVSDFCATRDFRPAEEATARRWLGGATLRFVYHFGGPYDAMGRPLANARMASACAISREIHAGRPGGRDTPMQIALECSDGSGAVLMQKVQAEPAPGTPDRRRWLVNGLTLVNNKGKPVKQYEPAFSDAFGAELPQMNGVSTTVFFDAAGRVVRTVMPDGSFSRVEVSPWDHSLWDANDNVLTSAWYRRNGRDRLSRASPLPRDPLTGQPTWTPDERAGWLAAQHADTPARVILDSLGREVIAVAHSRERYPTGPLILGGERWQDVFTTTFTRLDAENRPLWIRDALGHLVMQYITPARAPNAPGDALPARATPCHDMAGNLLFQHSMDAGPRWSLQDAAGRPMFGWDEYLARDFPGATAQRRLYTTDYDALHRPIRHWLKVDDDTPRLIEAFDFSDTRDPRDSAGALPLAEAQERNLIGQAVRHFDPSGLNTVERVALSGQPAHLARRLVRVDPARDGEPALDWNIADREALLEDATTGSFRQFTNHDALGRMTQLVNWHRPTVRRAAVYVPAYNARGLLQSERLHLRATVRLAADGTVGFTPSPTPAHNPAAIRAIRYNARGQRERLELGNGTVTTSAYDPLTFRLATLRTERPSAPSGLQDLAYTYDTVGNITTLADRAQEAVFRNNRLIEPQQDFSYDALYRLVQATGRENAAALTSPQSAEGPWPRGSFATTDDLRAYTQTFAYDAAGNIRRMQHASDPGLGWTRRFAHAFDDPGQPASNRLWRTWFGGPAWDATDARSVTFGYDSHGSMLNLNRVEVPPPQAEDGGHQIVWDWRDMIRRFDAIGGGTARYHYGSDKGRTRKHITRIGGAVEDRIYLGGFELYRRRSPSGTVLEEIETHHLFEGETRVLLVDDVIMTDRRHAGGTPFRTQPILRYQYGNHLGSVALELDEAARIISYEEFHPYGTSAYRLMQSGTEAPARRYRYTGMERDEESGLNYHAARYLAVWLGRWVSFDGAAGVPGLNRYLAFNASPAVHVDPSGNDPPLMTSGVPTPGPLPTPPTPPMISPSSGTGAVATGPQLPSGGSGALATSGTQISAGVATELTAAELATVGPALGAYALGIGLLLALPAMLVGMFVAGAEDVKTRTSRYELEAQKGHLKYLQSLSPADQYFLSPQDKALLDSEKPVTTVELPGARPKDETAILPGARPDGEEAMLPGARPKEDRAILPAARPGDEAILPGKDVPETALELGPLKGLTKKQAHELYLELMKEFGEQNVKILPSGEVIHRHHLLPREFADRFEALGLDIEKYTVWLKDSVHLNHYHGGAKNGGLWNETWKEFFEKNPNACACEVLDQLDEMNRQWNTSFYAL